MQSSLFTDEKKTRIRKFKPKLKPAFVSKAHVRVGAALAFFCIHVSLRRYKELTNVYVAIKRRAMQCSPFPAKKTRMTKFKAKHESLLQA
jgi:hypothetical protein